MSYKETGLCVEPEITIVNIGLYNIISLSFSDYLNNNIYTITDDENIKYKMGWPIYIGLLNMSHSDLHL